MKACVEQDLADGKARRHPGRVEVDLPVGLKRRLEAHARATGASMAGVLFAALVAYVGGDDSDPLPAWRVLAREADEQHGRRRPVLSLAKLSDLLGPAKCTALVRAYGGARLPTLDVLVSARRREGIIATWRTEGRNPRVIAEWFRCSPAYVRRVLRPWRWTARRRSWWARYGAAVGAGELPVTAKRPTSVRLVRLT
jgi:hypothetical protein